MIFKLEALAQPGAKTTKGRINAMTGSSRQTASRTARNKAIAEQFKSNAYTRNGRRKRGAGAVK